METLTHALLRDYADAFRTYGPLSNPVWFLGTEEGGGADLAAAARKILAWDRAGRPLVAELDDPAPDSVHLESPFLRDGGGPAALQTVRSNQVRVLLGLRGEPLDNARVRRLQGREHGRRGGQTCLMELFPLPSSDSDAWIYDRVAHDPATDGPNPFASRREYREHYLPRRLDTIVSLAAEHRPDALVCTSWTHRGQIRERLDEVEVPELGLEGARRRALIGRLGDTVVAVCTHPARQAAGPKNAFYHRLGEALAERMPPGAELARAA